MRILIGEHNELHALGLRLLLESWGHEVVAILESAGLAKPIAARLRPDVVLMDLSLAASGDGIEAAEAIRDGLKIPHIFVSAIREPALLARAALTAPAGHIMKPYDPRALSELLRRVQGSTARQDFGDSALN